MDEEVSVDILQQILQLKILDWDPQGSKILDTNVEIAESSCEDGLNPNEIIEALAKDIDTLQIVDEVNIEKKKPKRGRPKKRVVQRRSKIVPLLPNNLSAPEIKNTTARLIRATAGPLHEHFLRNSNLGQNDAQIERTTCDIGGQGQRFEDEDSDVAEILQQIMTSGILDWNPTDGSLNRDENIEENSIDVDNRGTSREKDNSKDIQRRLRGRPVGKGIAQRKRIKAIHSMDEPSSLQHIGPDNKRPVVRATSNPVKDHHQGKVNALTRNSDQKTNIYVHKEKLSTRPYTNQRQRGRPKKRVVHARVAASNNQFIHRSPSSGFEVDNVQDDYTQEPDSWSPLRAVEKMTDDEYRPSPPPLAIARSPSLEVPQNVTTDLTVEEIASRAMARPIVWMSALYSWKTLRLNEWLDAAVANYYLSHVWYEVLGRTPMRYVDLYAAM
ncbi:hypothetical protein BDR06DRAFT_978145, partial [Suillus hirtellus]